MIAPHDQISGASSLAALETRCARFDEASAELEKLIADLEADLEAVKQKHLRGLKRQAGHVAGLEAELRSAIEAAPELFIKPRSLTIHGVKVGFTLSQGKVEWQDDARVLALIKKHHKGDADVLIRTVEEPNKDALRALPAGELARLGCTIEGAGDVVICKRVAGDVEKLINRLVEKLVAAMVGDDRS